MRTVIALCIVGLFPHSVSAALPPDLLFSVSSGVSQAVLAASIALSGFWFSLTSFARTTAWRFWLIQICISAVILSCFAAYYFSAPSPKPYVTMPVIPSGVQPEYSGMRVVIVAKNTTEPLTLELDMNTRQNADGFEFYNFGEFVNGARAYSEYAAGTANGLVLVPSGFISQFDIERAPDLSARSRIHFSTKIKGQNISGTIDNIEGDFLEKNTPLYFKEVSVGSGHILVNGAAIEAYAVVVPTYSRDYTKYVYFKEYSEVRGIARQFILFDDAGSAYVIDRSDVENPVPAYTSHQWVLYKDSTGGNHKGFGALVTANQGETSWHIEPTDFPFSFDISAGTKYSGSLPGRHVSGTLQTPEGIVRRVHGIAHIETL